MNRILPLFILLTLTLPASATELRYQLRVDGLACAYCAYGIEKKIKALEGVNPNSVDVRLNEGLVTFEADTEQPVNEASLKRLVNDAGFTLRGVKTQPLDQESTQDES